MSSYITTKEKLMIKKTRRKHDELRVRSKIKYKSIKNDIVLISKHDK